MTGEIPTHFGDVLILTTTKVGSIHIIGAISADGQQDFRSQASVTNVSGRAAAVAKAKSLIAPGGRIFILNNDTKEWETVQ